MNQWWMYICIKLTVNYLWQILVTSEPVTRKEGKCLDKIYHSVLKALYKPISKVARNV